MPLLILLGVGAVAGAGWGAYAGSQIDDALDGGKSNILAMVALGVGVYYLTKKGRK